MVPRDRIVSSAKSAFFTVIHARSCAPFAFCPVHCRDLKPENLLYVTGDPASSSYNVIKVVDFGLAKLQNEKSNLQTMCGTPYFIAPEILNEEHSTYGAKVDVW